MGKIKGKSKYSSKKRKYNGSKTKKSVKIKPRTKPKTFRGKTKTLTTKRPVSRKSASLQLGRTKSRTTTPEPKLSEKQKKVAKQIKKRTQKRKQKKKAKRKQKKIGKRTQKRKQKKKGKRKQKKKQKRQRMKRIENSKLAHIPSSKIREFRLKFNKGKLKVRGNSRFKFLSSLDFPYSENGNLRSDFRKIVQQKVINKLPDYCEQAALVTRQKDKQDCEARAKRIRQRITERLKEKYS